MSWVIVEVAENFLGGRSVEVFGPFDDRNFAEMQRRARNLDRVLNSSVTAGRIKSYTREVESL